MNRRDFVKSSASFIAVPIIVKSWPSMSRNDGFTAIRNGVGIFEERGGTIGWFATEDALVVVDTQFPDQANNLIAGLKKKTERKLDLLINSHHHGDHTAGNSVLVPLARNSVAHENVPVLQRESGERRGNLDEQVMVNETYASSWSTEIGGEKITLNHYGPGHTGGDSIIHFNNANVAHVGDLVFNRMPPYLDRTARATVSGWIKVLEAGHDQLNDDTIVIHGHGNPEFGVTGGRADLLVMRDYLSALREYVLQGIKNGKSEDDLVVKKLPGFDDHYSASRDSAVGNGIRAAYKEFAADM